MKKNTLKFKNGKFKILVCSDLYEKTDETNRTGKLKTRDTMLFLDASVKALEPDLVVFLGDCAFGKNEDEIRNSVESITKTIKKLKKPLAVVFGDDEHDNKTTDILFDLYSKYDNCFVSNGDYNILLTDNNNNIKYNLWFFDSNGKTTEPDISEKYDWVHDEQIQWYEEMVGKIKEEAGYLVKSIVFQHIPIADEYKLLREAKIFEISKAIKGDGFFKDKFYLPNEPLYGNYRDPIGCPDFNNGQFISWKKMQDVKAAFFSNSHLNDFEGYVDNILLCQCAASGFHGCHDGDRCGIKLITINERDLSFETKNYHFSDFGIKSQSVLNVDKTFSNRQKRNIAVASAVSAGLTLSVLTIRKFFKKNK